MTATATKERTEKTDKIDEAQSQSATPAVEERPPKPCHPYVEIGMTVNWYADGTRNDKPHSAVVIDVGANNIALAVTSRGGGFIVREGVVHIKQFREIADNEEGAWDHTFVNQALLALAKIDWQYDSKLKTWK